MAKEKPKTKLKRLNTFFCLKCLQFKTTKRRRHKQFYERRDLLLIILPIFCPIPPKMNFFDYEDFSHFAVFLRMRERSVIYLTDKKKIKKKEKKNAIVRAVDHAIDQEKSKF